MSDISSVFAPDFRPTPYWWNLTPPKRLPQQSLKGSYDVAIVGSGLTGLRTAIELARAGLNVVVLEREDVGFGAARRNAGYLGRTLKKTYSELEKHSGSAYAHEVYAELNAAYQGTLGFIGKEGIDCFATRCGRFIAATSQAHLDWMVKDAEKMKQGVGFDYSVIPAHAVRSEMGTDCYCGGIVIPDLGSLHPGLYHSALLDRALSAGVSIADHTDVLSIERIKPAGFAVNTSVGKLTATNVVIATNGYTPKHLKWYARRLVPFKGYMAATEELPADLLAELIPNRRTIIDSNINIDFFRPAPDSSRLLFGGSAGSHFTDTNDLAKSMHAILVRIFPQLHKTRLSAVWSGQCAGTFDMMPHIGVDNGLWYGLGFNFAGVPMSGHFGMKIAEGILKNAPPASVFARMPFKSIPLYNGNPWFLPLAMRFFAWQDRALAKSSARVM